VGVCMGVRVILEQATHSALVLQNIVSFIGLFCKINL